MDDDLQRRMEAAGYQFGDYGDFLGLNDEERRQVEAAGGGEQGVDDARRAMYHDVDHEAWKTLRDGRFEDERRQPILDSAIAADWYPFDPGDDFVCVHGDDCPLHQDDPKLNEETAQAIQDTRNGINITRYETSEQMFEDLEI